MYKKNGVQKKIFTVVSFFISLVILQNKTLLCDAKNDTRIKIFSRIFIYCFILL